MTINWNISAAPTAKVTLFIFMTHSISQVSAGHLETPPGQVSGTEAWRRLQLGPALRFRGSLHHQGRIYSPLALTCSILCRACVWLVVFVDVFMLFADLLLFSTLCVHHFLLAACLCRCIGTTINREVILIACGSD